MQGSTLELAEAIRRMTIANSNPQYAYLLRGTTNQEQQVLDLNKAAAQLVKESKSGDSQKQTLLLDDVEGKLYACFATGIFVEKDFSYLVDIVQKIREEL